MISISKTITCVLLGMLFTVGGAHPDIDKSFEWAPENGEVLDFKVLRNGKKFGYHRVHFERDGNELMVRNDIELKAGLGPVALFYYRHESLESWRDGQLIAMNGETKKNGTLLTLEVEKDDSSLIVEGSGFEGAVPNEIIPSSHWNIKQIRSTEILSSENGETLPINVELIGQETLQIDGEEIKATRYRLKSALNVDLWYDSSGRWVKCQFEARGQNIEYVLKG